MAIETVQDAAEAIGRALGIRFGVVEIHFEPGKLTLIRHTHTLKPDELEMKLKVA